MLGSIGIGRDWRWAAYGKHPVASDYFRLGDDFPLGKGLSDWVDRGYRAIGSVRNSARGPCSWRFWVKGGGKDTLLCGLVRDSSDSVGRPYPLLIMGTGLLKGWESEWDLLPFICERTWDRIEYLSSMVVTDFKKLEEEMKNLRSPESKWAEFAPRREEFKEKAESDPEGAFGQRINVLLQSADGSICLDEGPFEDPFMRLNFWHFLLKTHSGAVPNSVFMGGTLERSYIVL
ncbi:MAG: DUF2094 domain-containing protein, partial [Deltaproteobacteria bacterium]